jgi:pimeloyl-ACP methyl ester carboxylesterase
MWRHQLAAERDGPEGVIERLLPRLLGSATRATQPEVVEQVRDMARRWSLPALVGALRVLGDRPDSQETLRAVRVPALVMVGSEDEISPPPVAEAMAKLVPRSQFHVVPAAGHLAPLEQPLATSRVLSDFLGALG